ncbi:S49 family peptidase [Limnohabitans sp.]|uniref:S49 family peptidase n=1 Tax=Limnohabitans sp. TaxID=1907725 RepID=UPI00289D0F49|nr:S49 family peptidase [Limnohabitans sp.]
MLRTAIGEKPIERPPSAPRGHPLNLVLVAGREFPQTLHHRRKQRLGNYDTDGRIYGLQIGKPTLISAGKFKVEGNPYVPLDPEAQAFMQSRVDDYYNAFIKAVAKGRGVSVGDVRDGMGEGRVLGADAALAAKMVDGVATFDDVLAKMQKSAFSQKLPGASRLGRARAALALI